MNIIEVEGVDSAVGHGYFHSSPNASSDMILILRDGKRPGDRARHFERENLNFWTMPAEYPQMKSRAD